MKTFKQHLSEDNVATLKKIVSNKQNMPLKMKDGSMKVDLFTASAFVKGMEKINPTNKKKVMDMINNGTKAQFLQLFMTETNQQCSSFCQAKVSR